MPTITAERVSSIPGFQTDPLPADTIGALLRRYIHGADAKAVDPLAWYEGAGYTGAEERLLRPDWQGSIMLATDTSGTTIHAINRYDEYGIPQSTNAGRFQYTGQAWLPDLGMYYYKARIYSPTLGRFMQTDPIGYEDQVNLYAYVGGDPVNKFDPTGLAEDRKEEGFLDVSAAVVVKTLDVMTVAVKDVTFARDLPGQVLDVADTNSDEAGQDLVDAVVPNAVFESSRSQAGESGTYTKIEISRNKDGSLSSRAVSPRELVARTIQPLKDPPEVRAEREIRNSEAQTNRSILDSDGEFLEGMKDLFSW